MSRQVNCPWCSRLVIFVDESSEVLHEVPVCRGFSEAVEKTNGNQTGFVALEVEDAKEDANRRLS